jgi:hypothetical protein
MNGIIHIVHIYINLNNMQNLENAIDLENDELIVENCKVIHLIR